HYYLDLGDCFGSEWADEIWRRIGHAYYFDIGYILEDLFGFGSVERPWDRAVKDPRGTFGYFSPRGFDPPACRRASPHPARRRLPAVGVAPAHRARRRLGGACRRPLHRRGRRGASGGRRPHRSRQWEVPPRAAPLPPRRDRASLPLEAVAGHRPRRRGPRRV